MPETLQLARSFSLPVPPDRAFGVLTDAEQVADVVPGAILTGWDGTSFAATVRLRLGLVPLVGHGVGRFSVRDTTARRAVVEVARRDGVHLGTVTITVSPEGEHSRADVLADLMAPRAGGRLGRSMVTELGNRMFVEASTALAAKLGDEPVHAAGSAARGVGVPRFITRALGRPRAAAAAVTDAAVVTAGITVAVVRRVLQRR